MPKRIVVNKAYKVGDLISLASFDGVESYDYPFWYVKKDFETSISALGPPSPESDYVDTIYPAWNEKMVYGWNTNNRYLVGVSVWKVWYKGILYEQTKWSKPEDVGIPPNEQVTNAGDNAGYQPNLKGELRIFESIEEEQDHPYPAAGHPSVLKNDSHTFRSWIVSETGQLNNPYWEYSSNLTYLVYNNYVGDDTPDTVSAWNWNYEQTDDRPRFGYYSEGWENPPLTPFRNKFKNSFQYQKNPAFYGHTIVNDGAILDEDGNLPDSYYPTERWQIDDEGSQNNWWLLRKRFEYPPHNLKYFYWGTFGFNPLTGLLPQKDTQLGSQYYPYDWQTRNADAYYAPKDISKGHWGFQSVHLYREGLQTRLKSSRRFFEVNHYGDRNYYDVIDAELKVIDNAYPPDDQLHISVVQDFPNSLGGMKTYNKPDSKIQRDGKIYFRYRGDGQGDSGEYLAEQDDITFNDTPLARIKMANPTEPEVTFENPQTDDGRNPDGTFIEPPPAVRTITYAINSSRVEGWYYYVEAYHPLFWLREPSVLEYKGEERNLENYSKGWTETSAPPTFVNDYVNLWYPNCRPRSYYNYSESVKQLSSVWRSLKTLSVKETTEDVFSSRIPYEADTEYYKNFNYNIGFASIINRTALLQTTISYNYTVLGEFGPPEARFEYALPVPCGQTTNLGFENKTELYNNSYFSIEDYKFKF